MNSNVLIAKNISKSFGGIQALKKVNFEVAPGQIHCLVGENGSGKSTFVKVVAGVHAPNQGEIILNGHKYDRCTVADSIREGVQVIYQDLLLFNHMSVAENIAIDKLVVQNKKLVDWQEIEDVAQEQLNKVATKIDLKETIENLSIANRQIVAICRALSMNAKLLFMDEPTTALTKREIDRLITVVLDLKKKGISIVFISHKLNEVMEVADQVAIFRDGEKVGDFPATQVNEQMLIYYMTGRKVEQTKYIQKTKEDKPILEVEDKPILEVKELTRIGHYSDISFKLYKGEILGIIGPMGAGRTELAMTIFGLNPQNSGKVIMEDSECWFTSPEQPIKRGISLVPENRQTQGLFLRKDLTDNVCSTILKNFGNNVLGLLDAESMINKTKDVIKELRVVTGSVLTEVQNLSGGNQQKVVLGKWIATLPKVLILDSPTVGVDVGARQEIYDRIQHIAERGVGIIFISDEIPEILTNCNKVLVMRGGKIVAYLDSNSLEADDIHKRIYGLMYEEQGNFAG
ncbi:sugar ABC transporter ATP-binding protein [Atribacter laminatus]|uniref:Galactose/methyl galactoside import ATP-binding protein MglA n=1 Tax=Atribacter laminatus TaxID=2847778 RepID=A0A7T1F2L8_ATRLM|nr:sugar ABC transporter ATP-binding protein [Atribacter laminatus]QPM67441.1 Galactose/methyl galactoside import ATP-binding protein MglA [Atribacter laminatus]